MSNVGIGEKTIYFKQFHGNHMCLDFRTVLLNELGWYGFTTIMLVCLNDMDSRNNLKRNIYLKFDAGYLFIICIQFTVMNR